MVKYVGVPEKDWAVSNNVGRIRSNPNLEVILEVKKVKI